MNAVLVCIRQLKKGLPYIFALILVGLIIMIIALPGIQVLASQDNLFLEGTPTFLPFVSNFKVPPVPQYLKTVQLPDAQCPNSVGFNATTGYVYVVNNFSHNVSVLVDTNFATNIQTGEWPTSIAVVPNSERVYVTNLHTGVSVIDGLSQTTMVPRKYEPYGVTYNPVNGYTYVSDLDSTIQIINGTTLVQNLYVQDPATGKGAGWLRGITVDPTTGLVYAVSWDYGKVYVLSGTQVVDSFQAGWGPINMAVDAARRYLYLAHSSPNTLYPHDISIYNLDTHVLTPIDVDPSQINISVEVAIDPHSGYAYVTTPSDDTVTVLLGTEVVTVLPAGDSPWGVAVNPNSGYAVVANRDSDNLTVFYNAEYVTTIPAQADQPFAVGVDTTNDDFYIANRGDEYGLFECRNGSVTILN